MFKERDFLILLLLAELSNLTFIEKKSTLVDVHNKRSLLDIRRTLRVNSTSAEEILWEEIRNKKLNGLKFKRQHSIGNYVVDFYCASKRLIIELDGEVHNTEEQKEKDQHRDQNLTEMNFKILRISNSQVFNDIETVKRLLLS